MAWGLLNDPNVGALGQGMSSFTNAYQNQKQLNLDKQKQQAGLLAQGYQANPDTGDIEPTPLKAQQQDLLQTQTKQAQDRYDSESDTFKSNKKISKGLITKYYPDIADQANDFVDESKNQAELEDRIKNLNSMVKTGGGLNVARDKANAQAQANKSRLDLQEERLRLMEDRAQQTASQNYGSTMKQAEGQIGNSTRVLNLLSQVQDTNGTVKANSQLAGDLSSAMASLVSQGKPPTAYGMQHQDVDSLYRRAESWSNMLQGKSDTVIPPDQLKQMENDVKALQNEWSLNHENSYKSYLARTPDRFQPKITGGYNQFRKQWGLIPDQGGSSNSGAGGPNPQANAPTTPSISREDAMSELKRRGVIK